MRLPFRSASDFAGDAAGERLAGVGVDLHGGGVAGLQLLAVRLLRLPTPAHSRCYTVVTRRFKAFEPHDIIGKPFSIFYPP